MNKIDIQINKALRLSFLWLFIQRMSLTGKQVAQIFGFTEQALYRVKRMDDIHLSKLISFFAALGFSFDIRMTNNPYTKEEMPVRQGCWYRYAERGQLPFLCDALGTSGVTMEMLSAALNLSPTAIRHSFKTNDIPFSRICKIASLFGMSVVIEIRPIPSKSKQPILPGSRLISSITFTELYKNQSLNEE
jgi:hypothetical protein